MSKPRYEQYCAAPDCRGKDERPSPGTQYVFINGRVLWLCGAGWLCQQRGCTRSIETFCPLCERLLCMTHDPLWPIRMHDCVRAPADEDAS